MCLAPEVEIFREDPSFHFNRKNGGKIKNKKTTHMHKTTKQANKKQQPQQQIICVVTQKNLILWPCDTS